MSNVIFFGDSITAGEGVSPHLHFVSLLARDIAQEYDGFNVFNAGYGGDTTRLALERMPHDVQSFEPAVLVAQFGLNDCNRWETDKGLPRVSLEAYVANLEEIAKRAMVFGAKAVIFMTSHPTLKEWQYEASRKQYNEAMRTRANECGITLIDIDRAWPDGDDLFLDDIHLNAAGHARYREIMKPYILKALDVV